MTHNQKYSIFTLSLMAGLVVFTGISSAQQGATAVTVPNTTVLNVGDHLQIELFVDLHGLDSRGGYLDLSYNPAQFTCISVENDALFGTNGDVLCDDSGRVRAISFTASLSRPIHFSGLRRFAVVTLESLTPANAAAISFAEISQIFGTAGGNMLSVRDDSATQQIAVAGEELPGQSGQPGQPGDPSGPTVVPEPGSLILFGLGLLVLFWRMSFRRRERC